MRGNLLEVSDLEVVFYTYRGVIEALNGVELWMNKGERLGVVGETGCGKSVTARSVMRLIEEPGKILGGKILFEGRDLLSSNGYRGPMPRTDWDAAVPALIITREGQTRALYGQEEILKAVRGDSS